MGLDEVESTVQSLSDGSDGNTHIRACLNGLESCRIRNTDGVSSPGRLWFRQEQSIEGIFVKMGRVQAVNVFQRLSDMGDARSLGWNFFPTRFQQTPEHVGHLSTFDSLRLFASIRNPGNQLLLVLVEEGLAPSYDLFVIDEKLEITHRRTVVEGKGGFVPGTQSFRMTIYLTL